MLTRQSLGDDHEINCFYILYITLPFVYEQLANLGHPVGQILQLNIRMFDDFLNFLHFSFETLTINLLMIMVTNITISADSGTTQIYTKDVI